jgi:hypothetical protein
MLAFTYELYRRIMLATAGDASGKKKAPEVASDNPGSKTHPAG